MFAIIDNPSNAVEWAFAEMMNKPEVIRDLCRNVDEIAERQRPDLPAIGKLRLKCAESEGEVHQAATPEGSTAGLVS
jgi:hypothetical protein